MARVTMRCEDDYPVPESLQTHSCIDDQTLGATDAKIRVKKHDRLRRCGHFSVGDDMSLWTLRSDNNGPTFSPAVTVLYRRADVSDFIYGESEARPEALSLR